MRHKLQVKKKLLHGKCKIILQNIIISLSIYPIYSTSDYNVLVLYKIYNVIMFKRNKLLENAILTVKLHYVLRSLINNFVY